MFFYMAVVALAKNGFEVWATEAVGIWRYKATTNSKERVGSKISAGLGAGYSNRGAVHSS